ncbi:MAG: WG repeat-containing protein [Bryobacteraceae bacterium]
MRTGRVVISLKFDRVEEFQDSRALVYIGSDAAYVDPAGLQLIPAVFSTASNFEQGRALVSRDGKYVAIAQIQHLTTSAASKMALTTGRPPLNSVCMARQTNANEP